MGRTLAGPVKITVCLGLIAGLLLTPKLWLSTRNYPLAPVVAVLHPIPAPFDFLIYGAMLLLLLIIMPAARPARWIAMFVILAVSYALFDQSRWQPWFYQYLFMLTAVALGRPDICRLMIASIYFWSGMQKLNPGFLSDTFPWMLQPFGGTAPAGFAYAAPFLESAIGIGLLTIRFRNPAVIGALAMHSFILASIGPFGHNLNRVVWPWNIAMGVLVILLFWRTPGARFRDIIWGDRFAFHRVVLVLFAILPALSMADWWDSYLSFSLYSGNQRHATLYMADDVAGRLPENVQEIITVYESESNVDSLDLEDWSYDELHVPPYAEVRVFKSIGKQLCRSAGQPARMVLAIDGKWTWFRRRKRELYTCEPRSDMSPGTPNRAVLQR